MYLTGIESGVCRTTLARYERSNCTLLELKAAQGNGMLKLTVVLIVPYWN